MAEGRGKGKEEGSQFIMCWSDFLFYFIFIFISSPGLVLRTVKNRLFA